MSSEDLPRLAETVHRIDDIDVRLAFFVEEQGEKVVKVDISARVSVICQRCLNPAPLELDIRSEVAIVSNEDEAKQLTPRLEPWIVEDVEADVYELIEEELLLNIPVVSYHDYDCIDPSLMTSGGNVAEQGLQAERDNPFSVLAGLKEKLPKK